MWKKIQGWNKKFLSQAGREVLIKSILQVIPTYTMQCFLLPNGVCDEITSIVRRLWWGNKENNIGIFWKNWDSLRFSKTEGGIGFWELEAFNFASLTKQGWRFLKYPNSLMA